MSDSIFPRGDVPESEKTPEWCKKYLDYAQRLLYNIDQDKVKITRLYDSYNGVKTPDSIKWLTETYGAQNRAKFIAYRVGRNKLSLLHGEWLKRPLTATVETINVESKNEKMQAMDLMMGAMIAKPELDNLKEKAGVDVMEGVPIPESEDDPLWEEMSFKDKQEDIMQIILDEQIKSLSLVRKFGDLFLDGLIAGKCFAKTEINDRGDIDFRRIDPRDFIYEEIEDDPFIEKSPIKGCRITMPIYEVLRRYELTKEQRDLIYTIQRNPDPYMQKSKGWFRRVNGRLMVDVIHIEWKASKPSYYKIMPKTPMQLEFDNTSDTITKELPWDIYEKNKDKYTKGEQKGEFKIETKWEEDLWEATRIGNIPQLDINMRRKPFQMRRHDAPAYILDSSYLGCLFNTVNGIRVPLQQYIENFDTMFDIVMYQILKELNRAKGKVLGLDGAAMPKGVTAKKVMYDALNDGFIMFNSAASGNFAGKNLDLKGLFQDVDLGFSQTFGDLLTLKQDILATLDRITGINEAREGVTPASSTVTNAQQSLQNSRTITEPIFYMMQEFVKKALTTIVESSKVSYAFYKVDKGEQILGSEKFKTLQKVTAELGYRDYGVHIEDGSRYFEMKQAMRSYMEYGMNTKEVSMMDAIRFETAQTMAEARQVFDAAYERTKQVAQQQQEQEQQFQAQQQQAGLQHEQEMIQQDVSNKAALKSQEIQEKTQGQIQIDNNKAQNKVIEQHNKQQSDLISGAE